MPITENVGGIMKTHAAEPESIGGVIREKSTVVSNDGGVLRKVFSSDKFKLNGITPLVVADDHIVIVNSGSGTISLPAGARLILGSGAYYTEGGYVTEYTLTAPIINASFTATIGVANNRVKDATKLVVGGVTYGCGKVKQIIQSKWGPIGGDGGFGVSDGTEEDWSPATTPTGAGGGGGGEYENHNTARYRGTDGGNRTGYGNRGGDGGYHDNAADRSDYYGRASSSQPANTSVGTSTQYGNGGCGGYSAGGGYGYYYNDTQYGDDEEGVDGTPGAGIIVIEL